LIIVSVLLTSLLGKYRVIKKGSYFISTVHQTSSYTDRRLTFSYQIDDY